MDVLGTHRVGPEGTQSPSSATLDERPGYLQQRGEQLYYVRHLPQGPPVGRALLAGPLGGERMHSYITWVRWARRLASRGFEVLRFDYRGFGESTGRFEDFGLDDWMADLELARDHLDRGGVPGPLLVTGLRMGALLTSRLFARGHGDLMLLWGPPASGREMLTGLLRRKLAEQFMQGEGKDKGHDRAWYVRQLELGRTVEVNSYPWAGRLWGSTEDFDLALPGSEETRPWRMIRFDPSTPSPEGYAHHVENVRIQRPPFWQMSPYLLPDVARLLEGSMSWVQTELRRVDARGPAEAS